MTPLIPFMMITLWCSGLHAQSVDSENVMLNVKLERERIQSERQAGESLFSQQDVACYQRFSVSDCLDNVRSNRRLLLDDLRRQTMVLNDVERRKKTFTKLDLINRKTDMSNSN